MLQLTVLERGLIEREPQVHVQSPSTSRIVIVIAQK